MLLEKPVSVEQRCSRGPLLSAALGLLTVAVLLSGIGVHAEAQTPARQPGTQEEIEVVVEPQIRVLSAPKEGETQQRVIILQASEEGEDAGEQKQIRVKVVGDGSDAPVRVLGTQDGKKITLRGVAAGDGKRVIVIDGKDAKVIKDGKEIGVRVLADQLKGADREEVVRQLRNLKIEGAGDKQKIIIIVPAQDDGKRLPTREKAKEQGQSDQEQGKIRVEVLKTLNELDLRNLAEQLKGKVSEETLKNIRIQIQGAEKALRAAEQARVITSEQARKLAEQARIKAKAIVADVDPAKIAKEVAKALESLKGELSDEEIEKVQKQVKKALEQLRESAPKTSDAVGQAKLKIKDARLQSGKVADQLKQLDRARLKVAGAQPRPRLGIEIATPSQTLREQLGLKEGVGIVVVGVQSGTPADKAGVRKNDVLVELNRKPVPSDAEKFQEMVAGLKSDSDVDAVVIRKGKRVNIRGIELQSQEQRKTAPKSRSQVESKKGRQTQKSVTHSVTRTNDRISATYSEGSLTITVVGKVEDGKFRADHITVRDGNDSDSYNTIDDVPQQHRERIERMFESIRINEK